MDQSETQILNSDARGLARAVSLLKQGRLVAFATETVYGLGADARSDTAVAGIFAAKNRPGFNPLIVHVPDRDAAQAHVQWNDTAEALAAAFWPGPLTLVLPLCPGHGIAPLVTAGLDTLAVRVPAHRGAQNLLRAFGGPLAAPSANPSGRISATSAAHVMEGLGGQIAGILDDGICAVGLESTIVGLTDGEPVLLRPGGVAVEQIKTILGAPLKLRPKGAVLTAPGQMLSHYAPRSALRLNAVSAHEGEVMLGFGPQKCTLNLSKSSDLSEAAANLFAHLHQLDQLGQPIAVAPIPAHGIGHAINDRLQRAAAPRT
ncbi:MAG: threonylcarbamoyl-AMP synthase [Rhodobacteraceae bacterium]|nr:threonylcarbamoyl-AMP synthase [Paracoccaceae bacterium]